MCQLQLFPCPSFRLLRDPECFQYPDSSQAFNQIRTRFCTPPFSLFLAQDSRLSSPFVISAKAGMTKERDCFDSNAQNSSKAPHRFFQRTGKGDQFPATRRTGGFQRTSEKNDRNFSRERKRDALLRGVFPFLSSFCGRFPGKKERPEKPGIFFTRVNFPVRFCLVFRLRRVSRNATIK